MARILYFIYIFYFTFIIVPQKAICGLLQFPPESCQNAWSELDKDFYLYSFDKDKNYTTYLQRLHEVDKDRKNCHKTWTVLIYMSATKDLIPYAFMDLLEMEAAHPELFADSLPNDKTLLKNNYKTGSTIRTDVIVQLALATDNSISRFHMFESPKNQLQDLTQKDLSKFSKANIYSPEISSMTRSASATEAQLFEDFLKWGIEEYPSEYYFVIIWGHGQGWTSIESSALNNLPVKDRSKVIVAGRYGGLAFDGKSDYLDIPRLNNILKQVQEWSGDPIAMFASDACLMQSVEDVTEFSENAQYVYGSEDIESYAGFPYCSVLSQLNSGNFDGASIRATKEEYAQNEPYLVAWMMPQLYQDSFDPAQGSQKNIDPKAHQDLTGCSVATKHVRTSLVPTLNQLGKALLDFTHEERSRWADLKYLIQNLPSFQGGTRDLGSFLKALLQVVNTDKQVHKNKFTKAAEILHQTILATYSALNYSIVNSVLGDNYPKFNPKSEIGPRGLSIWLPQNDEEFVHRFEDFSRSKFWNSNYNCKGPGWKMWMFNMYPKGAAKVMTILATL